jgi:hypothetical protein
MTNDRVGKHETHSITLCSDGVYAVDMDGVLVAKVAEPIKIKAYAISRPDGKTCVLLEFMARDGNARRLLTTLAELKVNPKKLLTRLSDAGYLLPERRQYHLRLLEVLSVQKPEEPDISVDIGKGLNRWSIIPDNEPLPASLSVTVVPPPEEPLSDDELLKSFARRIRGAKFLTPEEMEDRLMTAVRLKERHADGFRKRDSKAKVRAYLLTEKLSEWFKKDKARLVRLLKDGDFLHKGRSGSNTNTYVVQVGGKSVSCYTIRKSKILELVSPPLKIPSLSE